MDAQLLKTLRDSLQSVVSALDSQLTHAPMSQDTRRLLTDACNYTERAVSILKEVKN